MKSTTGPDVLSRHAYRPSCVHQFGVRISFPRLPEVGLS